MKVFFYHLIDFDGIQWMHAHFIIQNKSVKFEVLRSRSLKVYLVSKYPYCFFPPIKLLIKTSCTLLFPAIFTR